ncbi:MULTISPECIES: molybdenum cofactor guanylyltransferase [unclassified Virgibacillus]|uniref:molybdenum cofactor guanylyltransferase n=1 Tax=unclassified Virgibacillus TaxID=2620237 RepID=UPI0024DE2052|nr:molybdenum cofactor guanylyltransferase [Virgibacillus sp. LDC-1]
MKTCGVILAGGQSSRMGTNKALLNIGGKSAIEHVADKLHACCDDVIIISNDREPYIFLNLSIFPDNFPHKGPLAGMETALQNVQADAYLFAACDMPLIEPRLYMYLLTQLGNYDAVVPSYNGQLHPLAGIYRRTILPKLQNQLTTNNLRVRTLLDQVNVLYMKEFPGFESDILENHFFNMNYPVDYEVIKTRQ